ncbi:MAG TPA: tetratricopeptide repeat protein [Patescibacteria group bacterium]|nr:tetratricopeptide repeat protein [Patescibacteria group bacterium]
MAKAPNMAKKEQTHSKPAGGKQPVQLLPFKEVVKLHEQGKLDEAALGYRRILLVNPKDAPSWLNLGTLLRTQNKFEAALACTQRALELSPENASAWTNYGNALMSLDRHEESLAAHEKAVALSPDTFLLRSNFAIALREAGESERSVEQFNIAAKMKPEDSQIQWERAMTYLDMADFKRGWESFEIRWELGQLKQRGYQEPQWAGEDLTGKTIVLHEEQGFGDTIIAARYIPLVKARGGRVILQCNKALHRLFANIGADRIIDFGDVGEKVDYQVPMMSLPGIFKTDFDNMPPPANLTPAPLLPGPAHLLKNGDGRLKVGIVWSGSVTFARNAKRAVSVERFLPFAQIPGVQLYSLQKGPCEPELAKAGGQGLVLEMGPLVDDFADTAAVINELDLVIMTDSSVAHLTGSLGKPIWNLLCYRPYWLYTTRFPKKDACAWYPSMRYFRQEKPGDWDQVFRDAHAALTELAKQKTAK